MLPMLYYLTLLSLRIPQGMFKDTRAFNQPLNSFDTSRVTSMQVHAARAIADTPRHPLR